MKIRENINYYQRIGNTFIIIFVIFLYFNSFFNCLGQTNSNIEIINQIKDKISLINIVDSMLIIPDYYSSDSYNFNNELLQVAIELQDITSQIQIQIMLGDYLSYTGSYDKAADEYFETLSLSEKIKDQIEISHSYRKLGELFRASASFNRALEMLHKAETISLSVNDSIGLTRIYDRLGAVFYEMSSQNKNNNDSALLYIKKSIEYAERLNDLKRIINGYNTLGAIYYNIGQYKTAIKNHNKALEYMDTILWKSIRPNVLNNLARDYIKIGLFEKAINSSKESYELAISGNFQVYILDACNILSEANKKKGDFSEALNWKAKEMNVRSNLYTAEKDSKISEIQAKYDMSEKDKRINEDKYKQDLLITVFVLITIGLIILLLVYYFLSLRLKKKNLLISEQKESLITLNATKDKFFSIIAHDLKNPLGSFRAITKLLHEAYSEFNEEERISFLELMKNSADNIYSLLDNLLEWSRCQRGIIQFDPIEIYLDKIIENNLELLKISADYKKIILENKIKENIIINGDPNLLNTVIRNLISNAIKFTHNEGKIEISLKDSNLSDNSDICVLIKDNGIGMKKETIEKLFRIDAHITTLGTNSEKGTGLGLILCKEFIDKHGGKIWVESEEDIGSTFYFTLPKN